MQIEVSNNADVILFSRRIVSFCRQICMERITISVAQTKRFFSLKNREKYLIVNVSVEPRKKYLKGNAALSSNIYDSIITAIRYLSI